MREITAKQAARAARSSRGIFGASGENDPVAAHQPGFQKNGREMICLCLSSENGQTDIDYICHGHRNWRKSGVHQPS